jgi:hypothetical protein
LDAGRASGSSIDLFALEIVRRVIYPQQKIQLLLELKWRPRINPSALPNRDASSFLIHFVSERAAESLAL